MAQMDPLVREIKEEPPDPFHSSVSIKEEPIEEENSFEIEVDPLLVSVKIEPPSAKKSKKDFSCRHCPAKFDFLHLIKKHVQLYHKKGVQIKEKKLNCPHCAYFSSFDSDKMLEHINKKHLDKKTFDCPKCTKKFPLRQLLMTHMENHKNYKCKLCDMKFVEEKVLLLHITSVHCDKSENCGCPNCEKPPKCEVDFLQSENHGKIRILKGPKNQEDQEKIENIEEEIREKDKTYIINKVKKKHKYPQRKVKCGLCDEKFTCKEDEKKHLNEVHFSKLSYFCFKCNYRSNCKLDWQRHQVKFHQPLMAFKKYVCAICHKIFDSTENLESHMVHEHEKTIIYCPKCDFKTPDDSVMSKHLKIHFKFSTKKTEKPKEKLYCDVCPEFFWSTKDLRKHLVNFHKIVKMSKCQYCLKQFATEELRKIHLDKEHLVFKCDQCTKGFSTKIFLDHHKKMEHEN